jgi:hypothetical protein
MMTCWPSVSVSGLQDGEGVERSAGDGTAVLRVGHSAATAAWVVARRLRDGMSLQRS